MTLFPLHPVVATSMTRRCYRVMRAAKLVPKFLYHYYACEQGPFRSLADLPLEEAEWPPATAGSRNNRTRPVH